MIKKKNKTKYALTITSFDSNYLSIRRIIKKFDDTISSIKFVKKQKTIFKTEQNISINKYLHYFVITTKPSVKVPKIWYTTINNKRILDIIIKLL